MPELRPVVYAICLGAALAAGAAAAQDKYRDIVQALKSADAKVLHKAGIEIVAGSPEAFAAFIRSEMERMGAVIKSGSFRN